MYGPSTSARRNSQHQEAPQTLGTAPHSTTSSCTCRTGCKSWAGSGLGPGLVVAVVAVKAVLGGCLGSSPSICGGCASACTGCLSVPWSMEWPTSLPSRNRALFNRACERLCCIFPRKEKKKIGKRACARAPQECCSCAGHREERTSGAMRIARLPASVSSTQATHPGFAVQRLQPLPHVSIKNAHTLSIYSGS